MSPTPVQLKISNSDLAFFSAVPALTPPAGVTSNFIDPPTNTKGPLIVSTVLFILTTAFILNRVYVKLCITKKVKWDDGTILLGFVCCALYYAGFMWEIARSKQGRHQWDVRVPEAASADLFVPAYVIGIVSPLGLLFIKDSFFIFYLEVFGIYRWIRVGSYLGLVLTTLFYFGTLIAMLYLTTPRPGETWLTHQLSQLGRDEELYSTPQACVGLAIDVGILMMPILAVMNVKMRAWRKVGVMLILMTGLMACIASALNIHYRVLMNRTQDLTWADVPVITVMLIELLTGVITACMPAAAHSCRQHLGGLTSIRPSWFGYHSRRSKEAVFQLSDSSGEKAAAPNNVAGKGALDSYHNFARNGPSNPSLLRRMKDRLSMSHAGVTQLDSIDDAEEDQRGKVAPWETSQAKDEDAEMREEIAGTLQVYGVKRPISNVSAMTDLEGLEAQTSLRAHGLK